MPETGKTFRTIRKKLFYTYGLLMTAFIIVFLGLSIFSTYQLKTKGIDNLIEISIDAVFRNIESLMHESVNFYLLKENEKIITLAEEYMHFVSRGYMSEEDARMRLRKIISSQQIGESGYTFVMNYEGIILEHPYDEFVNLDYSTNELFRQLSRMDGGYLSYEHENPGEDSERSKVLYMSRFAQWNWMICTSAYEDDPVMRTIRLEEAATFLNDLSLENVECITILDGKGNFLIQPENKNSRYIDIFNTSLKKYLSEIKQKKSGNIMLDRHDGIIPIVFYNYIDELDWIIIASGAGRSLYAPVISTNILQLIAIILAVILLYLLNRILSRKFTAPLNELVTTLDRYSSAAEAEKVMIKTGDEFEILGEHFNNFLERQKEFLDDISSAQKSIRILAKFPDENPNPVIRISNSGIIEYANKVAVDQLLSDNNLAVGDRLPEDVLKRLTDRRALTDRNEFYGKDDKVFSFIATEVSEQDGSYLFGRDITRQKKFESLQLLSENIFQNSIEGIVITDGKGDIESVNPAFTEITEYTEEEVLGKNPRILKSHMQDSEFYKSMWDQLLKKGFWEGEIWNRKKNGTVYPEFLTITSLKDESGEIVQYISFFHDLSEIKEREKKIEYEATHDQLTGLPNRIFLAQNQKDILSGAEGKNLISIVYMDINNLKRVNESMGPEAGDTLLIEAADRFRTVVKEPDVIVRLGSDEYAFIFHNTGESGVEKKIEEISNVLEPAFLLKDREVSIDASFGVSFYPSDSNDLLELIAEAESAMAVSKKNVNRNYEFYSPVFNNEGLSRLEIETGLKAAFENGDFYLNYQPKVSVETGKIIGAEALLRVRPIEDQFIGPDIFIPVAEEIGLIEPLGAWVLETACSATRGLISEGYSYFNTAVNLSPYQFRKAELPQVIGNIIGDVGIPSRNMNLEITESMAINNVEESISMMHKLTDLGLMLSIDDFGTGYSSLSYLSQFPVNILKIDKAFVVGIPDDPKKVGIVQAILSLSENLGMETVAEGVETEQQFNFLKERGCQVIQGYYFYKPMLIDDLKRELKKQ